MKQKSFRLRHYRIALLVLLLISLIAWSCNKDTLVSSNQADRSLSMSELKEWYSRKGSTKIVSREEGVSYTPFDVEPKWETLVHSKNVSNNDIYIAQVDTSTINLESGEGALVSFFKDATGQIVSELFLWEMDSSSNYNSNFLPLNSECQLTGVVALFDKSEVIKVGRMINGTVEEELITSQCYTYVDSNDTSGSTFSQIIQRDGPDDCYDFGKKKLKTGIKDFLDWWRRNFGGSGGGSGSSGSGGSGSGGWWSSGGSSGGGSGSGGNTGDGSGSGSGGGGGKGTKDGSGGQWTGWGNETGPGGLNSGRPQWEIEYDNCRGVGGNITNTDLCDLQGKFFLPKSTYECLFEKGPSYSAQILDYINDKNDSPAAIARAKYYISLLCSGGTAISIADLDELFTVLKPTTQQKAAWLADPHSVSELVESLKSFQQPNQQTAPFSLSYPSPPGRSVCANFFSYYFPLPANGQVYAIFNNLSVSLTRNGTTIVRPIGGNLIFKYSVNDFNINILPNVINSTLSNISTLYSNNQIQDNMVGQRFFALVNEQLGSYGSLKSATNLNLTTIYIPKNNSGQILVPITQISLINLNNAGCP